MKKLLTFMYICSFSMIFTVNALAYDNNNKIIKKYKKYLTSKTPLLYVVDRKKHNVIVISKAKYEVIKTMICSVGSSSHPTPKGTFSVTQKGYWFYSKKYKQGGKYWVRFHGRYLFHSLPMNKKKQVVDTRLGGSYSHGCIRLSILDAKWLYSHVRRGTKVIIR